MIEIVPLELSHLDGVKVHTRQAAYQYLVDNGALTAECLAAWTVFDDDVVVAYGGLVETEDGTAGWLLFSDRMEPRHLLPIYRTCKAVISDFAAGGDHMVFDMDLENPAIRRWADILKVQPLKTVHIEGAPHTRMIYEGP
jgi:hypothetical protein